MLDYTGLLEPQKKHALTLLNSLYLNGVACDLSDAGTGKTFCASWVAKQFNTPVVVICPKSVIPAWKTILKSFGITASIIINYEKLMRGNTPHLKYKELTKEQKNSDQEIARYQLTDVKFPTGALIICDEAHKCKSPTSLNAGLLISLKRKGYRILTLSATQASKPTEMKSFGYVSNLHNLYQWRSWCLEHGAEDNEFGILTFNSEDKQSQEKMKKCHTNLFNQQFVASRLTREQMGSIFPDNHINPEAYDLGVGSIHIKSIYDTLEDELAKLDESTENYSSHVFALMMKARMRVELCKMPFFIECIDEIIEEKNSAVIFVNFNASIEYLTTNLKHKFSLVVGGQSEKQREQEIKNFQENKTRVIICNTKSGGSSISLHDLTGGFPRQSLISPTWSAIDLIQIVGRICRAEGKSPCYQRIIYADGTIENRMCDRTRSKITNINYLNDGDLAEISFI